MRTAAVGRNVGHDSPITTCASYGHMEALSARRDTEGAQKGNQRLQFRYVLIYNLPAMETHKIDDIRRGFSNEWLLIAVDEVDSTTQEPLKGHLLAHGPNRESIHDASKTFEGVAYVVYSDDWPDDLAACFLL